MNTSMKNRSENKIIRALFTAAFKDNMDARYKPVPRYYNDLRLRTRRRIFKTFQDIGTANTWTTVLMCLESLGDGHTKWELWQSPESCEVGIMCREAR